MSPSLELQKVVVARLKADAGLIALVAGRVYDHIPPDADFPYISIGNIQTLNDDIDCHTGFEIFMQIDAWSRSIGPELKQVSEAVRLSLHQSDPALTSNAMVSLEHNQTREFRDPDGLTTQAALEFVALVEQP